MAQTKIRTEQIESLAAGDITSGTFADARVAETNVTQHEAAIDHDALTNFVASEHIDWTSDQGATNIADGNVTETAVTQHEAAIDHDALTNFVASEHIDWTSDQGATNIADANITETAITQHEAAIDHDALTNFSADEHRTINDAGSAATDLWSADKISTELAGKADKKVILSLGVVKSDTAVTTGDGNVGIPITSDLNGYNIIDVQVNVHEKGVTGTTDVQIRRQRGATDTDVLSTKVTLGDEYYVSDGVVNTSNDDLSTGDMLFVDIDAVHSGTPPNGLSVAITAENP